MKPRLLATRLALAFALLSFAVVAAVGYALYMGMERQLILRDDAALVNRVDQLRTLLRDADIIDLIHHKPQLFANMLGNRESLLVVKFAGQAPLVEVNPGKKPVPDVAPVAPGAELTLSSVHHAAEPDGTPFISVAATALTADKQHELQIISGRLMTERAGLLRGYRDQILLLAVSAAALTALLSYVLARRGLLPVRRLAVQTAAIGIRNLSVRLDHAEAPGELLPLIAGFNGMLDRLETGFTQLSQVSADMAHDLRTPIGNMLGQIEVALGQPRDPAYYQKLMGSNFEELQRLSKTINNMLFLARAEHADHAVERSMLDVAQELELIGEYFEGPAEQGREGVTISVYNTEPTITPQHLARIFDRFYRADPSRHTSSGASGLGLSIVRSIMGLHQGTWHAASAEGATRFTLFFPNRR